MGSHVEPSSHSPSLRSANPLQGSRSRIATNAIPAAIESPCPREPVDASTGSLGHGLSIAAGMALVAMRDRLPWRGFALLSDGECDEGSTWEPILFAPQHRLNNLVAIVDYNKPP